MKITKIEPSKHKAGRVLIFLEDGSLLKAAEDVLLDFSLRSGDELDEGTLARLKSAAGESSAKEKAVELLTRRAMTKKQLRDRLVEKGAGEAEAKEASDWAESIGAVDDADFASSVVRHYSEAGCGPAKIRAELGRRGVPKELWDAALAAAPAPDAAIDAYLAKKLCGAQDDKKAVKRAADGLLRRGFRWDDVKAGLSRLGREAEDG
jgi:regulatory protein